jgi:hypothetical protein
MPHPTTGPLVLDGGLATELAARGFDLSDALWSARLLADAPEAPAALAAPAPPLWARPGIAGPLPPPLLPEPAAEFPFDALPAAPPDAPPAAPPLDAMPNAV